ncbi:MAG: plasmid recombination protein [Clostridia bacterium]|nr:plasmid recombination protein [Clostridia bacterium]
MAHMQKFKGSSATHILGHCERERGKEGYLKYRNNSYIDESRTHLNRSHPASGTGQQRLHARLDQVAPQRRKDAVTMIDWVVTLPEQLQQADHKTQLDFFRVATSFMVNRYGEQNLVGAYIHFDETTPHLHYCFVPVVTDPDGTERLCAKQLMSRKELNAYHKDLDQALEDYFDMPGLALTGITKAQGGNKSVAELKKLSKQVEALENAKNRLEREIGLLRGGLLDALGYDTVIDACKAMSDEYRDRALIEISHLDLDPRSIDVLWEAYERMQLPDIINPAFDRQAENLLPWQIRDAGWDLDF